MPGSVPRPADDRFRIFISYSRSDSTGADALVDALTARGFDVMIDRRILEFGEKWQAELAEFIRQSDTVIWLVSEASVRSPWVNWELDEVGRRSKRLVPVMVGETPRDKLPRQLGEIHILPPEGLFDPRAHLDVLIRVLETDRPWLREGSRLADRAYEWLGSERGPAHMLRGAALATAEAWKDRRPSKAPAPSPEILELILASRRAATRRQRYWTAGAVAVAAGALLLAGLAYRQSLIATDRLVRALISQGYGNATLDQPERALAQLGEASALAPQPSAPAFVANMGVLMLATRSPDSLLAFRAHSASVTAVAISPAGDILATGGPEAGGDAATIKLWSLATGQLLATLPGHGADIRAKPGDTQPGGRQGTITTLAFGPTGDMLLSAGTDGRARLWRVATRELIFDDASHAQVVTRAVLTPNAKLLATTGYDSKVRIFDLEQGVVARTVDIGEHAQDLQISSSGQDLLVALDKEIIVLDLSTGAKAEKPAFTSADFEIGSFRVLGENRMLVSDRYGRLIIVENGVQAGWSAGASEGYYSAGDLSPILALNRRGVAAFRRDGRRRLALRKLQDEDEMPTTFMLEHDTPITSMATDPDETVIVTGDDDGTVRVWPLQPPRYRRHYAAPRAWITGIDFDQAGHHLGFSSYGGDVVIVDLRTGRRIVETRLFNPIGNFVFAGGDDRFVYSSWNGPLHFNRFDGSQDPRIIESNVFALNSLKRSSDGRLLATSEGASVVIRDARSGEVLRRLIGRERAIHTMTVVGGGELAVAASGPDILAWREGTLAAIGNHGRKVEAIVATRGGASIVACGEDGRITTWDASRTAVRPTTSLEGRRPIAACWSDVLGEYALTLHVDGGLAVWDLGSPGQLGVVTRSSGNGWFASIAVSADQSWLAFTNSRVVHAWHVAAAPKLLALKREVGGIEDGSVGTAAGYPPARSLVLARWLILKGYEAWAIEAYGLAMRAGLDLASGEVDAALDTIEDPDAAARIAKRAHELELTQRHGAAPAR
jgi:WD40 repeat protein